MDRKKLQQAHARLAHIASPQHAAKLMGIDVSQLPHATDERGRRYPVYDVHIMGPEARRRQLDEVGEVFSELLSLSALNMAEHVEVGGGDSE